MESRIQDCLGFPYMRATKEIGDVCTQAMYLEAMVHRGPIFNLGSYFFESDLNGSTLPPPLVPVNAPFPDTGHIATLGVTFSFHNLYW